MNDKMYLVFGFGICVPRYKAKVDQVSNLNFMSLDALYTVKMNYFDKDTLTHP